MFTLKLLNCVLNYLAFHELQFIYFKKVIVIAVQRLKYLTFKIPFKYINYENWYLLKNWHYWNHQLKFIVFFLKKHIYIHTHVRVVKALNIQNFNYNFYLEKVYILKICQLTLKYVKISLNFFNYLKFQYSWCGVVTSKKTKTWNQFRITMLHT